MTIDLLEDVAPSSNSIGAVAVKAKKAEPDEVGRTGLARSNARTEC